MEYLAVASRGLAHDLKNLITPVSSYLVHTDGLFPPESPAGEVHATAKRATQIMSDYVRENLFFAEKLSPKFERFEIRVLLEQAREAALAPAEARKVTIAIPCQSRDEFVADRVLLQRMLVNLLTNAIDASAPGGAVTISAREIRPGWIRFDVSDQGSGIPQENLCRIFDPYFTTKEFGDELRGFGLGLTIAQKIALLHHGEISVSSRAGHGTTFSVDLPNSQTAGTCSSSASESFPLHLPSVAPVMP
jgi:signal transduction histidine kinase